MVLSVRSCCFVLTHITIFPSLGAGTTAVASVAGAHVTGMGFLKMADVVDECPPLAKLFEGGLERFQEVFQVIT